jgi:hypothetical protein
MAGCGSTARSKKVTAAMYGGDWPYTVQSGTLRCESSNQQAGGLSFTTTDVTLTAKGTTYALNGAALGDKDRRGWRSWREIDAGRGSYVRVIDDGLALCGQG